MKYLVINAYDSDDPDAIVADVAIRALESSGHAVEHHRLHASGFVPFMSSAERAAYHTETPLQTSETTAAAAAIATADGVLFCYPTVAFSIPAVLKGWFERVLVPGVAIGYDAKGRVTRNLQNVQRLGVVTTCRHPRREIRRARDLGRRTIMWTLRLSCHPLCRRTFVSMRAGSVDAARIERRFGRW